MVIRKSCLHARAPRHDCEASCLQPLLLSVPRADFAPRFVAMSSEPPPNCPDYIREEDWGEWRLMVARRELWINQGSWEEWSEYLEGQAWLRDPAAVVTLGDLAAAEPDVAVEDRPSERRRQQSRAAAVRWSAMRRVACAGRGASS